MKTIKIAYDPTLNLYMGIFSDFRGFSNQKILVDNKEVQNPFDTHFVIFKEKPTDIVVQKSGNVLSGFKHTNGTVLEIYQYNELKSELEGKGFYDEDIEEFVFSELEDEIAYIRFKREWSAHYTTQITEERCILEIVYHAVSDIPEITPMYLEGGGTIFDTMCVYNCNAVELFIKRCEKFGLTKAKHENEKGMVYWLSFKDNYRFAKLGGEYCTTSDEASLFKPHRKGSYTELKELHNINIKRIDDIINSFIAKQNNKKLSTATFSNVLVTLNAVRSRLNSIEANKKTSMSYNSLKQFINQEIKALEEIAVNENH